jgi:hypothetical protein
MDLKEALKHIEEHGFGDNVDADAIVKQAAEGLVDIYDRHGLEDVSGDSAADQCATLYDVLNGVGLAVA